jgi:hypothetical protein
VATVLGGVLVAAGVLKLTTAGDPLPLTAAVPAWATGLVPLAEVGLGVWFVSGVYRFGAWAVALPVMVVFALYSLALTAGGRSSCGCFGSLTVPPVVTLLFDVLMVGLLVRCRPGWHGWPADTPALRTAAVAVALLVGAAGWAYARYGSVGVAVAAARGEPVAVAPASLYVGAVPVGGTAEQTLRVVNLSDEPVQVAMVLSSCNCARVDGLPATVAPGASVELPVAVSVGRGMGEFRRPARLRTSVGDVGFSVAGWVTADPNGPVVTSGLGSKEEPR